MPSAEIITIGTELLLGEIVDTNAQFLARCLRNVGIDLRRKTTVGDNAKRIAEAIQQALERCEIIITTGGLGPTVDDPTREAVALAVGIKTEYHPELWEQIEARFRRFGRIPTENNRQQAYIPKGAKAIENPVGTAPIFILEHQSHVIISLPGVPREMEFLMEQEVIPFLSKHYDLREIIKTRTLHTVGVGESQIDDLISDLEELSNPTVGLAAHSGQVDVRITAKADSEKATDDLIHHIENMLRDRLGDCIYGADQETLAEIALRSVEKLHWTITAVEAGLDGILIRRLAPIQAPFLGGQVLTEIPIAEELMVLTDSYRHSQGADVGFGVALHRETDPPNVSMSLITPFEKRNFLLPYGGTPDYAALWALNQSLNIIRRITNDTKS
jgi:competence/damage-inducible protein CinA-like protein